MITTSTPQTWQDLQTESARILQECGFAVEVEKVVETARGRVEIDVFGEENVQGRRFITLCECKHWRAAVPQAIIHGFRTVVGDIGANKGYIISMAGFQAGAFSAAELTNLELVTWEEFQAAFEPSWLASYFSPELLKKLNGLMTHAEHFLPAWFDSLSEPDQEAFIALKERHEELGWLSQSLAMHPLTRRAERFPRLPLSESLAERHDFAKIPDVIGNARGYRQVLEAALELGGNALAEFRAFQRKASA